MALSFIKMHGLGNDFVILDGRAITIRLPSAAITKICDRRFGIGCDQLIVMEPSTKADVFMRIYNADGSESASCGNATRCVAWLIMQESSKNDVSVETKVGLLNCKQTGDQRVMVDMGAPIFDWRNIPLSNEVDVNHVELGPQYSILGAASVLSMGNPHAVFIVSDASAIDLAKLGPELENHPLFPERANISIAQVIAPDRIKLRVWERGAGTTLACGTAACAALVACARKGLASRIAKVSLPGGDLDIRWDEATGHVVMTGGVALVFEGQWHG
ncbi:MAG: diaminopimelate epimerase [Rickettsiales bacterium]|jgi:diaminopimelate epimerase|nr:diaminopimelate epimerase [Rickettsiales bacterium]